LKESLIDVISKQNDNSKLKNDISNNVEVKTFDKNHYNSTHNFKEKTNSIYDISKLSITNSLYSKEFHVPFNISSRNNSYLNYISVNDKKNVFLNISKKFDSNDKKNDSRSSYLLKNENSHVDHEEDTSKSLIKLNKTVNEKKELRTNNDSYNEDEVFEKSHYQLNKTFSNSSLAYDKSTFMSNKTYVNNSFDKSNCNMSMTSCRKVLGEINNILDSRNGNANGKDNNTVDNTVNLVSSPIHDYQISTTTNIFPDNFDKTLTSQVTNVYNKKSDSFNYDGFIDEENDPFNSKVSHFDLFDKSSIDNEQESIGFNSMLSETIDIDEEDENNYDQELSQIIEKGCESSFIDFNPYELYMNAFYSKNDFDLSNSKDSIQGNNDRNTILTKDVIDTLSSVTSNSTSLSTFTDSSIGIKKVDLDIRFTEDNQIKAEHIANMTPGTFFGLRSAPLGCLDGESLTPSQRVTIIIIFIFLIYFC